MEEDKKQILEDLALGYKFHVDNPDCLIPITHNDDLKFVRIADITKVIENPCIKSFTLFNIEITKDELINAIEIGFY